MIAGLPFLFSRLYRFYAWLQVVEMNREGFRPKASPSRFLFK